MSRSRDTPPSPPGSPVIGHTIAFASDPYGFVERSVESTGDVFRMRLLGTDRYILAHPDHAERVLRDRDAFSKPDDFELAFGEALLSVEGEEWQRQRGQLDDFFTPSRIGDYAETMVAVAERSTDDWPDGETVDLAPEMQTVALEILFEVILGRSLAPDEVGPLTEAAHALNLWFKPTSWVLPDWVPTPARRRFHRGDKALRSQVRTLLDDAGEDPDESSLLTTLATLAADPESAVDDAEVVDQMVGMVFAGHETSALAMTYALHLLGSHPAAAERFHTELDAIDGRPSLSDLGALSYLDRVITETLRLYPPIHTIPRSTTAPVAVGDYTLPDGANLMLSVRNIHRDSRFYDDPATFDPDRWADTTPREKGYAFVPFGAGPRSCIGRHFARLELKAVLAVVGQRFELDAHGDIDIDPQMTAQPASPVRVRLDEL